MNEQSHYSMVIQWSDEDQAYIVSFPEWKAHGLIGHTHGDSYDEAVKNGREALTMLVASAQEQGEPLPPPHIFVSAVRVS